MAETLDIRFYTTSKVMADVADISIVRVRMTIEGCLVVEVANGGEVLVGPISISEMPKFPTQNDEEGGVVGYPYKSVEIDDIRVISAVYVIRGDHPVALTTVSYKERKFFIGRVNEADVVLDISKANITPLTDITQNYNPPLFCNSFASVLKISGNGGGDNSKLEKVVLQHTEQIATLVAKDAEIENRLQIVEASSGVVDLTIITEKININSNQLRAITRDLDTMEVRVSTVEAKARVGVVKG